MDHPTGPPAGDQETGFIIINEAAHQREEVLRLDVRVVEPFARHMAGALVFPDGEIEVAQKSRHLPPWTDFEDAVWAYLERQGEE